ncbi:insulin-like growth factor-binding protein complex acid labile subunit [Phymastichus coffea]|uniref:insulin-like growth factor-binding protein complex acid labile subunit n=1 Tax=Phymastichus coffea TaxID=108790 RepID=UPI00273BB230|nr:insulin-like growth factor-binding protein complex acid labile subunit [Phymastichus coffea]
MEIFCKSNFLLLYFVITFVVQNSYADVCQICLCSSTGDTTISINCNKINFTSINIIRFGLVSAEYNGTLGALDLSETSITYIVADMFETSKYLKILNLSHNHLQEIKSSVFKNLNNLKVLDLSNNKIKTIQSFYLPSLEVLDLSNNAIDDLDFEFQKSYPQLHDLRMSHNNLSDSINGTLTLLTQLRHLDLSCNYFNLYDENFKFLTQLITLNLSHNAIEVLEKKKFPDNLTCLDVGFNSLTTFPNNLGKIQTLNLEYNKIRNFDNFTSELTELKYLNISGNLLKNLPDTPFFYLKTVDLSFNNFEIIPPALNNKNYPALENLILSENPLQKIEFYSNLDIKSLIIRNINHLTQIHEKAFRKLNKNSNHCVNLTLANNNLSDIHENTLKGLNLCFLDLKNNQFSYLPKKMFDSKLKSTEFGVDLEGNPFNCNCSLQWMLDDFVPWLYFKRPALLLDLRCMAPEDFRGMRMVHWHKWKNQVFCEKSSLQSSRMIVEPSAILGSGYNSITLHTSDGMVVVLIVAVIVLLLLVVTGIITAKRLALRRTRINRRF